MHSPPFRPAAGPARPASAARTELSNALPELPGLHAQRMLVVEDDRDLEPIVRRAAATLPSPVAVDWCADVAGARRALRARLYDLVLADYQLEGDQAGLALRRHCEGLQPQAAFAMTSAYRLDEYLHSVGRAGSPFLAKPFDVPTCRRFVAPLLSGDRTWVLR